MYPHPFSTEKERFKDRNKMLINQYSKHFDCGLSFEEGGSYDLISYVKPEAGQWYYVVCTYEKGVGMKIYVDGLLKNWHPIDRTIRRSDFPLRVGENAQRGGRNFDGVIDEVRVFNYALSDAEVRELKATSYQPPASQEEQITAPSSEEFISFHHADHLGSASIISNDAGEVISDLVYFPYGGVRREEGSFKSRFSYNDKEEDESGLHYYGARYYDSRIGRWISNDPLQRSELTQIHGYAYVGNNPIIFVDPFGLDSAVIIYGNEYKEDRKDPDAYKRKAEARADELQREDNMREKMGMELKYSDGIITVDGSDPENWKEALSEIEDIALIVYYGHASSSWGLLLDKSPDNASENVTLALSVVALSEYSDGSSDMYITDLPTQNIKSDAQIYLLGCNTATGGNKSIANTFAQHFRAATLGIRGYTNFKGHHAYVDRLGFNSNIWSKIGFEWFDVPRYTNPDSNYKFIPKIKP